MTLTLTKISRFALLLCLTAASCSVNATNENDDLTNPSHANPRSMEASPGFYASIKSSVGHATSYVWENKKWFMAGGAAVLAIAAVYYSYSSGDDENSSSSHGLDATKQDFHAYIFHQICRPIESVFSTSEQEEPKLFPCFDTIDFKDVLNLRAKLGAGSCDATDLNQSYFLQSVIPKALRILETVTDRSVYSPDELTINTLIENQFVQNVGILRPGQIQLALSETYEDACEYTVQYNGVSLMILDRLADAGDEIAKVFINRH